MRTFPEGAPLRFELRPEKEEAKGRENGPPDAEAQDTYPLIRYSREDNLAQALFLSGRLAPPVLCNGLALCGRCKARILSSPASLPPLPPLPDEETFFSPEELEQGLRLTCRHSPLPGLRVEVMAERTMPPQSSMAQALPARPADAPQGADKPGRVLAVDLGTTSLAWRLAGADGAILAQGSFVNPQMGAGSDVISRLFAASRPEGLARLFGLTLAALRGIIRNLPPHSTPERICLAANPAMSAIALGLDPTPLAAAPYSLPEKGGRWFSLADLPPLWLPPQLSPFAGGDLAAGYAALCLARRSEEPGQDAQGHGAQGQDMQGQNAREQATRREPPDYPWLLADLGTNGELLLALSPDTALAASLPMGPALEGAGLACGTEARPGAAVDFRLSPGGLEALVLPHNYDGAAPAPHIPQDIPRTIPLGSHPDSPDRDSPRNIRQASSRFSFPDHAGADPIPAAPGRTLAGLTGTGALSLLHLLLRHGLLDRQGRFSPPAGPLARLFSFRSGPQGGRMLLLPGGLHLSAGDVEELLKVKAAFSLALSRLLSEAGIEARQLRVLCLAGALGAHLRPEVLGGLGFVPPGLEPRLRPVGNSALDGALLLARSREARRALTAWAAKVQALDLAADPAFGRDYPAHMRFTW